MKDNYYGVLGVNPSASVHSIQAAYRQLAKACHPDHAGASATEKFQILQEAYEVLSDPDKREAYDFRCRREEERPARYHIVPEPLVPAPAPRAFDPEPLVQERAIVEQFSDRVEAHCPFGHRLGHEWGTCLLCDVRDSISAELQGFIRRMRTPSGY